MNAIIQIPQKQFFEYGDKFEVYEEVKNSKKEIVKRKVKLNLIDYSLFDYLFYLSNISNNEIILKNKRYVEFSYKSIINNNPQLRISNRTHLARKIKKLSQFKLIDLYIDQKNGNKTYFNIPQNIGKYFILGEVK